MRIAALLLGLAALAARAEPVSFGLFGDTPYGDWERTELPKMIREMDAEDLAFVVHDGDIKNGSSACSDAVFQDILGVFQASRHPLVYVPGDNEWTDCHRRSNGGYDPLERLARLRRLFFADDFALGRERLQLERQSTAYPENVRWRAAGILLVGLNIPGSNNNWGPKAEPSKDYLERGVANRAWLADAFALARAERRAGIMVVIQANPNLESARMKGDQPDGYRDFVDQLRAETLAFPGQVVLVHGDSHYFRIDQPLADPATGKPVANFTRVETYGAPFLGWIKATADAAEPKVFRFEPRPWRPQPAGN